MTMDSISTQTSSIPLPAVSPAAARHAYNTAAAAPASAAGAGLDPNRPPPRMEDVREAVKKMEEAIVPGSQDLRFTIDEDTGTPIIKLIDTRTDTVLRQIPTVEALEISKALDKLQGLLVRETA